MNTIVSEAPPRAVWRPDAPLRSTIAPQLGATTWRRLPPSVRVPAFDTDALRPGILHLGCGAFHRAHQAWLTDRAIEAEAGAGGPLPAWGIVAVSLRSAGTVRALKRQQGLYSVLVGGPEAIQSTVVGSLRGSLFAPEQPQALRARLADAATRIVSLTVTAGGYGLHPLTGRLDTADPEVQADLRRVMPRSSVGLLVAGLRERRLKGIAPPVILCCDNLPGNGRLLRQACIDHAALHDGRLAEWIATHVQFPATMVDRIVPATTSADREEAQRQLGVVDAAPVVAEPFIQWVIEHFDGPRPRWDAAGVEYVNDVAPWETSKLRLLNGGHLALAYLGLLAGRTSVAEALDEPLLADFALRYMLDEQIPTLPPSNHDVPAYARQLIARWRNPGIEHALIRIVREGSTKLEGRWLEPLRQNLREGRPVPCSVLALAACVQFLRLATVCNARHLEDDHGISLLTHAQAADASSAAVVEALRQTPSGLGELLRENARLIPALGQALEVLRTLGAGGAMLRCLERPADWGCTP